MALRVRLQHGLVFHRRGHASLGVLRVQITPARQYASLSRFIGLNSRCYLKHRRMSRDSTVTLATRDTPRPRSKLFASVKRTLTNNHHPEMATIVTPRFKLNNGTSIPAVGLGCWMGTASGESERAEAMVAKALKIGYRAFDTAAGYGNEEAVGRAIRAAAIPRRDIFVTTKLRNVHHHCVEEGFNLSFKALNLEYIDLFLMHWPQAIVDGILLGPEESPTFLDTWKDMERLLASGKVRAIGVSNLSIARLQTLIDECTIVPAVNQIECHPSLPQFELVEFCQRNGIHVTAYSSLGQPGGRPRDGAIGAPDVFFAGNPLKHIADRHNATVGQVLLSWAVQRGISVIPKSEKEERMRTNLTIIELQPDELSFLNDWHKQKGMHRSLTPYHGFEPFPNVYGWTYEQHQFDGMGPGGIIS